MPNLSEDRGKKAKGEISSRMQSKNCSPNIWNDTEMYKMQDFSWVIYTSETDATKKKIENRVFLRVKKKLIDWSI